MPYITKDERTQYDDLIEQVTTKLLNKFPADNGRDFSEGDLNYIVSSITWKLFDVSPSYKRGNKLVGCLDCIKHEFFRRRLDGYESKAIEKNGDINLDK